MYCGGTIMIENREKQASFWEDEEDELTSSQQLDEKTVKRSLDELFYNALCYRSTDSYGQLMNFVTRFRFYSPYNAMLLHVQKPGAQFVAPAYRWRDLYGRYIKAAAQPLVILQPMGPVMFVFDVSDTEPGPDARVLPRAVTNPFEGLSGKINSYAYDVTVENAKRDGIKITFSKEGSQSAGSIRLQKSQSPEKLLFPIGKNKNNEIVFTQIPVRYQIIVNENLNREAKYATIVHELAHLYCGHLGTPNEKWWPERRRLIYEIREFEAESVSYVVCKRLNIHTPSDSYLSSYLKKNNKIPNISPELILKVAGLIETMGKGLMKPRKEKE